MKQIYIFLDLQSNSYQSSYVHLSKRTYIYKYMTFIYLYKGEDSFPDYLTSMPYPVMPSILTYMPYPS